MFGARRTRRSTSLSARYRSSDLAAGTPIEKEQCAVFHGPDRRTVHAPDSFQTECCPPTVSWVVSQQTTVVRMRCTQGNSAGRLRPNRQAQNPGIGQTWSKQGLAAFRIYLSPMSWGEGRQMGACAIGLFGIASKITLSRDRSPSTPWREKAPYHG